MMDQAIIAFGMPGWPELLVIAALGLLIFGRRLPDVARSVGKSIVEFKKGIREVKDDVETHSRVSPPAQPKLEQSAPPASEAAPKVEVSTKDDTASSS